MGMGANRPAFTQGPHGKRKAFHDKVRSFLKDKQSMGFDPQGIYIYIHISYMYLYTTLNYKARDGKLTCLKNCLKYNYVFITFLYLLTIYIPHHFSFTCCVFPVAVTCWSLLAWRRPPFAAVCSPFSPGVPSLHPRCGPLCFPSFSHSLDLHQP